MAILTRALRALTRVSTPVMLALGVALACVLLALWGCRRHESFFGAIASGIGRVVSIGANAGTKVVSGGAKVISGGAKAISGGAKVGGTGAKAAATGAKTAAAGAKVGGTGAKAAATGAKAAAAAPKKGVTVRGALLGVGGTAAGIGGMYYVSQYGIPGLGGGGGGGGGDQEGGAAAAATQPTYVGRQWDGADWSCPAGTVETGSKEDATACISSQFHPPVWKTVDGTTWDWHCPNGTVPSGDDSQWERKCEVGWTSRVLTEGAWKCPSGTEDSGKTWDNSSWAEAQKQCRRTRPYTLRVNKDGTWVCPEGSTDTKRSWGDKNEWDQCKWTGP